MDKIKEIAEIAARIRGLRELMDITPAEMAEKTDVSLDEYEKLESGESDFSFTFIYKCAERALTGVSANNIAVFSR